MINLLKTKSFYFVIYTFIFLLILINNSLKADQEFKILSDKIHFDKEKNIIYAEGNVLIIGPNIKSKSDEIHYDRNSGIIEAKGNVIAKDKYDNTYFLDQLITNEDFTSVEAKNVKIRLKDDARVVGSKITKNDNLNIISNAEYTSCLKENYLIKNCPGWKLKSSKVYHNLETRTFHYNHARLHIFNIPIFYLPYFTHPDPSVKKRTGFLMPTIASDDQLGDAVSLPFFYNISENKDLTFTPNFQSKGNNFYEFNYRHLNDLGLLNLDTSINDNGDDLGTRSHIFADADISNNYGSLQASLQTSNNDTYMRKNKLNNLTVLKSGINFNRSKKNTYFSLVSSSYKHLTIQNSEQWEHVYPQIVYDITNIKDDDFSGNVSLNSDFTHYKGLNNSYSTTLSSQLNWLRSDTHSKTGLVFDTEANSRILYSSSDNKSSLKDERNLVLFPQISSKISYPLGRTDTNYNQTLTPIIMPILAPYNNHTETQSIDSGNIFSTNRATGLTQWESGPRVNYGIEWYLDKRESFDAKVSIAQSLKVNKDRIDTSDEISDYMLSSRINFDSTKYINNSFIIDRKDTDIKQSNINAYFDYGDIKFAIDHDYTSSKYLSASEQIRIGGKINFQSDFSFNFTATRDLNQNNNIGYQYGILYENDCLGINFNYYEDLTKDRDIEESDGFSFTIVLKPFGSTKSYGKTKIFGPQL